MALLILGLILFIGTHLLSSIPLGPTLKAQWGENKFKAIYSLLVLAGLVLLVIGYGQARSSGNVIWYMPPDWLKHVMMLLMIPAFVLFFASFGPGKIRTMVKHPQTIAIKTWAFAHLLANGDRASVILFGSFLAWAVWMTIRNKRMGKVPAPSGFSRYDVIALALGLGVYVLFVGAAHRWLIGVPVVGG